MSWEFCLFAPLFYFYVTVFWVNGVFRGHLSGLPGKAAGVSVSRFPLFSVSSQPRHEPCSRSYQAGQDRTDHIPTVCLHSKVSAYRRGGSRAPGLENLSTQLPVLSNAHFMCSVFFATGPCPGWRFEIVSQGSQDIFSIFCCYATWLSTVVQLLMTQLLTQIVHFPEMLDFSHISYLVSLIKFKT